MNNHRRTLQSFLVVAMVAVLFAFAISRLDLRLVHVGLVAAVLLALALGLALVARR